MSLIHIDKDPNDKTLRQFGLIALCASCILAGLLYFVKGLALKWTLTIVAFGIVVFVVSLVSLKAVKLIYLSMIYLTFPIGLVVSFVIMAVFYYLILTPVGLVFKILNRDLMYRKLDRSAKSYWVPHKQPKNMKRYFQQF